MCPNPTLKHLPAYLTNTSSFGSTNQIGDLQPVVPYPEGLVRYTYASTESYLGLELTGIDDIICT